MGASNLAKLGVLPRGDVSLFAEGCLSTERAGQVRYCCPKSSLQGLPLELIYWSVAELGAQEIQER